MASKNQILIAIHQPKTSGPQLTAKWNESDRWAAYCHTKRSEWSGDASCQLSGTREIQ